MKKSFIKTNGWKIFFGVILLFLFVLAFLSVGIYRKEEERVLNFYLNDKDTYIFQEQADETLQKVSDYHCDFEDCSVVKQVLDSFFLVRDKEYYLIDVSSNPVKRNIANNLPNSSDAKYKKMENENYLLLGTAYSFYDIYSIKNDKLLLKSTNYDHFNIASENEIFLYNDKNWAIFSLENETLSSSMQLHSWMGPYLYSEEYNNKKYYILHYGSNGVGNFEEIYNSELQLITSDSFYHGLDKNGNLLLTASLNQGLIGGINHAGYFEKVFETWNEDGHIKTSREYSSVQTFIEDMDGAVNYFFAVDKDNILKLYTMDEQEILSLEEWNDNKVLCNARMINEDEISIPIGEHPKDSSMEYTYNFKTKQLSQKVLPYEVCQK